MDALIPPITTQVLTILSRRACDALSPIRSLLSQFRASANKRAPSEPSSYILAVLLPIKTFFEMGNIGRVVRKDFMTTCSAEVFDNVCNRLVIVWPFKHV